MKTLLSTIALSFALTASAFAADLPYNKAPPYIPPPPPPLWTGFYVGVNAGGTFGGDNTVYISGAPLFAAPTFINESAVGALLATSSTSINNGGFIGGGQVGYNYQFNPSIVVGLEADIQGVAGSSSTANSVGFSGVPAFLSETAVGGVTVTKSLDYLGTVRGRLGWLVTPVWLIYGTGGLAYGGVNSSTSIVQSNSGIFVGDVTASSFGTGTFSDTHVGWTVGGGVEWLFLPNWSAKVEYLYYDLGTVSYGVSPLVANAPGFPQPTWIVAAQASTRFDGHIARAGVNYHFNWPAPAPVLAKY
jgi:outer membrane immunogenic protein